MGEEWEWVCVVKYLGVVAFFVDSGEVSFAVAGRCL